jgi:hypothetical protein
MKEEASGTYGQTNSNACFNSKNEETIAVL